MMNGHYEVYCSRCYLHSSFESCGCAEVNTQKDRFDKESLP